MQIETMLKVAAMTVKTFLMNTKQTYTHPKYGKNVLIYNSNLVITITSQLTLVVVALGITDMMAFSIRSFFSRNNNIYRND